MAYPQYAGNGGTGGGVDDFVDIPFPATVNQYDILVATVLDADDDTFIVPTGWAEVATVNGAIASTVGVFWRRADGTETGVQRFYSNSASGLVIGGVMARFTGCVRTGTPYEGLATEGVEFSNPVRLPSVVTTGIERLVSAFIGIEDNKTLAQATSYTQQYHLLDTTGSDFALGLQTRQVPTAQTVGAQTAALELNVAENWATINIALIPSTKFSLQGGINVLTSVTGNLKRKVHLSGAVSASSTVSGDVKAKRGLKGAINAAATVAGALSLTMSMAGSVNATSSVSGDLKATYQLQGSISAQSTVAGDLIRIGPTWSLEGHIEEQSDVFADSMYPVPQWTLVKQWTGRSYGDSMGYDADRQFLAMGWTPNEDVTLAGIQVWLSQEDKLPPFTAISGGIWLDDGAGKPDPWNEVLFSTMTERRADKIADGTQNTGGGLYTFEFGLYDPAKPRVEAGKKYFIILYPQFGGTSPENAIWWQGDGSFDRRNERWHGDDTGEVWSRTFGGTRFIKIFAAPNQVHSLEGHVAATSTLSGELLKNNIYYVRADGTATTKEGATSPNSASTSMSPTVWASETFEPGDTIVWSAKGGSYEQVSVANASSGTPDHPIVMRGEFGGTGRPWISGGIQVTGGWTKDGAADRWYTPLVASPKTRNLVADGVDLGVEAPTPSEVDQPGEWYHSEFDDLLYMGGASAPSSQFSEIWVQKNDGIILAVAGNNWVVEDLFITLGYRSDGYTSTPCGFDASYRSNITVRGVGGVGHYGLAVSLKNVFNLFADELDFSGCIGGIDISGSSRYYKNILQRSSFLDCYAVAVKVDGVYATNIYRVETSAFERNFLLSNVSEMLIEQCKMGPISWDTSPDALLSGVNITGNVTTTVIRNCQIDGGTNYGILAGIAILDPDSDVDVSFVHNQVLNANYGLLYVFESTDSIVVDLFAHNNTVVNTIGGFYQITGGLIRISIKNNIFFNYLTSWLDDPQGGWVGYGTAEQPTAFLSFTHNHYRDPRKPLTWFWKVSGINFGAWCVATGETNSFEQNPQLKNPSAGQYWLASGSPAAGTGDGDIYKQETVGSLLSTALVPGLVWPVVQVADQNDYESPSWNRGAYLPEGADGTLRLQGAIDAISGLNGNLEIVPNQLEGHVAAQSSLYGNLRLLQGGAALPLSGSIGAKSNVSGDLFAPTKWSLEGHVTAKSYLDGDLYTPTRHYLAGAISAQSSLSGLLEQKYLHHLSGAIEAQSALSADLMAIRQLEGSIDAQSSVSGDLTMVEALWDLEGHIAAQSALSGDLHVHSPLEGHIAAQSSLSGELAVRYSLAGAIAAQATVSGELVSTRKLEGHIAAQSTVSGALGRIHPLAGAINAQSTVSGDLTQIDAVWELEGHVAAKTTLAGNLIVGQTLAIDDADHGHTAEGAKEINGSVVGLNGTYYYDLKPGGQLLEFSFDAIFGYQVTVGVARNIVPISTQYLTIRQNSTKDLIITDEDPGDLYVSTNFFTWGQHYIFHVILYEDSTLSVYVNGSHKWTGSVKPALLTFEHGTGNASTPNNFELISWNYPTLDLLQHHFISIDEALHGHAADVPLLVENIDLVIDDALHGHTADEPTVSVTHHLEIDDAFHLSFAEELDLVEGITLSIDDATHGHSADGLDLDQAHVLAINDAAHYHLAEPLALGGTGYLGINSALHGHTADNIGLTQAHDLVIDDADHGHQADALTISVHSFLEIDDADHGHSADSLALSQDHALGIDDALHGHAADEPTLAVTSFLAIDDTVHGHASDNLDLIENIDLVIDGALHGHAADGLALVAHHMLEIDSALHGHAADNLDLTQGITLVIDGATHAHDADGLTLEEKSLLTIQDAFHLHLADEVPLVGNIPLVVDNAVHSHTADAIALQQTHVLEIDDCLHLHRADNLPISTVGILGIASAKHGHTADAVTLGQAHSLSIADATHGHASDEPTLAEKSYLQIDSAAHSHAADPVDLQQTHVLAIDDSLHSHSADPCNLTPTPVLVIADTYHMHWADVAKLTQEHSLVINDATHGVTSDNLEISQVHTLVIDDCLHGVTSPQIDIGQQHLLTIEDTAHGHAADELTLAEKSYLVIDDATHAVTSDEVGVIVRFALEIDDADHAHAADELTFNQQHILEIDDCDHSHTADNVELVTPWYQTQRASAIAGEACTVAVVDDDFITATLYGDCIDIQIDPSGEDCT